MDEFPEEAQPKNIRDRSIPGRQSGRKVGEPAPEEIEIDNSQPPEVVNVSSSAVRDYGQRRRAGRPMRTRSGGGHAGGAPGHGGGHGGGSGGPQSGGGRQRRGAPPSPEPPSLAPVRKLLEDILERMGVPHAEVSYIARTEGEYLEVRGPDLANLIGRHGHTLEALNIVFNNIVNAGVRNGRHYYTIDAEGYRARRADLLRGLALQTLERVMREKKPIALEPMLPSERKVIHLALADNPYVSTESSGVEPERHLVVSPK